MKKIKLTSLQNASVIRKFNIYFIIISIIPMAVLAFVFWHVSDSGQLEITKDELHLALIFTVLGVFGGYGALRGILVSLSEVTKKNTDALGEILGQEHVAEIKKGSDDEIAVLTRTFNDITTRLEENVKHLQLAQKTLHSVLNRVGKGLSTYDNLNDFLNLIVETVTDALLAKRGFLMVYDEKRQTFKMRAAFGVDITDLDKIHYKTNEVVFGQVATTRAPFIMQGLDVDDDQVSQDVFSFPMICAPMMNKDKFIGVMVVCGRRIDGGFFKNEMGLLQSICTQTAIAMENDRLSSDAERTYFETISALAIAVEARDPYSRGHSERVSTYCVKLAEYLNLTPADISDLRDAARVHDIGKIGIADEVLDKPGPLTDQEWLLMKKHPEIGEGIIKPIKSLSRLCSMVRNHHEKVDGSGYPDGLKGDQLTLLVRILAVADAFDALTTDRAYRKGLEQADAIKLMRETEGHFDPSIVAALEAIVLQKV